MRQLDRPRCASAGVGSGWLVLIDCHSMPTFLAANRVDRPVDVALGDRFGRSCHPQRGRGGRGGCWRRAACGWPATAPMPAATSPAARPARGRAARAAARAAARPVHGRDHPRAEHWLPAAAALLERPRGGAGAEALALAPPPARMRAWHGNGRSRSAALTGRGHASRMSGARFLASASSLSGSLAPCRLRRRGRRPVGAHRRARLAGLCRRPSAACSPAPACRRGLLPAVAISEIRTRPTRTAAAARPGPGPSTRAARVTTSPSKDEAIAFVAGEQLQGSGQHRCRLHADQPDDTTRTPSTSLEEGLRAHHQRHLWCALPQSAPRRDRLLGAGRRALPYGRARARPAPIGAGLSRAWGNGARAAGSHGAAGSSRPRLANPGPTAAVGASDAQRGIRKSGRASGAIRGAAPRRHRPCHRVRLDATALTTRRCGQPGDGAFAGLLRAAPRLALTPPTARLHSDRAGGARHGGT